MLNIKVNNQDFAFNLIAGTAMVNGKAVNADTIKLEPNKYHVLINNQSFTIELLSKTENGKGMFILVNGAKHEVEIKDRFDALLSQLGMDKLMVSKSNLIKAPMPGMVLQINVKEGDVIKKGEPLLVLEAMKMENIIKADQDGTVKRVGVAVKQAVEKNTVLVELV
ncbi:MAG: biotin/lipoyl-containing protein [Bacteroidota bacterium]|nr:biotin/lipoyl-containing protein [Bacteroidota bacterium]